MVTTFQTSDRIGDIVAKFPKAGEIFRKNDIDYCCGGNRSLAAAIKEQNLDERILLDKLDSTYQKALNLETEEKDWLTEPLADLIDHIVNKHHTYLKTTLPTLSELVTTILRAHGAKHHELRRVHKLFHTLKMDLEQHLITEEEVLFPMIKEYEKSKSRGLLGKISATIDELESEHESAGDILKELRSIATNYTTPEDACPTYDKAYKTMEEVEGDIFNHIHLENNILHKRIRQLLH